MVTLLAEPCGCSARNVFRGSLYLEAGRHERNLLEGARLDAAYERVTPRTVRETLTGRNDLLRSGERSNVVLYLTGHGGDGFLKFHDADELSAVELADAIREMRRKRMYRKLLVVVDTCQAASLFAHLDDASGVLGLASSRVGENAYASTPDPTIGVALADRFTEYVAARFFASSEQASSTATVGDLARAVARAPTRSTLAVYDASWDSGAQAWDTVGLSAFFSPPGALESVRVADWPLSSARNSSRGG